MQKKTKRFYVLLSFLIIINILDFSIYSSTFTYYFKFIIPLFIILEWLISSKFKITINFYSPSLIFLIGFLIINIMLSNFNITTSLESIFQGFSYIILLFISFIVAPSYIKTKEDYIGFLTRFLYVLIFMLIINVILGYKLGTEAFTNYENRLRYKGFFENANMLGSLSLLGVILSFSLKRLTDKNRYMFSLGSFFLLIYYSNSKTSLITSFLFIIIDLFILKIVKNKKNIKILSMLLMVTLFIGVFYIHFKFYFNSDIKMFNKLDFLTSNRLSASRRAFPDTYNFINYLIGKGVSSRKSNPHNAIIDIFIELGIIGVFLIYSIKFLIMRYNFYFIKKINDCIYNEILVLGTSLMIILIVFGFTESVSLTLGNILSIFAWLNFGIQLNMAQQHVNYDKLQCYKLR